LFKQKGLGFKVFIFTALLIILTITIVLVILYFALPGYYLSQKHQILEQNANTLETRLSEASTEEFCAGLIADFAETNNANIIAFDAKDMILPQFSSPFLSTSNTGDTNFTLNIVEDKPVKEYLVREAYEMKTDADNETDETVIVQEKNVDTATEPYSVYITSDNSMKTYEIIIDDENYTSEAIVAHEGGTSTATERFPKSELIGRIVISSTLQPIDEAQTVIISLMPYLLLIAVIIAFFAAYLFARQLTKPILQISGAAERMREMQPDVLSNVNSGDELGQLSYNLDSLYVSLCNNIQTLQSEMDKVSKLEQSKTDFMRAAGHELKTPIATLNGMVEGMIDNVGAYKNREKYLYECKEQIRRLAKLVNEILTSSQLDTIDDHIEFEDIEIGQIMDETIGMYDILIKRRQLQLMKEDFDFSYRTDGHILRSVLSNLIANAVNYTVSGGEIIILFRDNVLSIENQCDNIDEEVLPKLFEPFFTLNYSRDRTKSGTGLGLYIIKKNLEALNLPYSMANTTLGLKFSIVFE
jgi:signal transduction histidine kinase